MEKVKRFEPISASCKDCGRDFIITADEQNALSHWVLNFQKDVANVEKSGKKKREQLKLK